MKEKETATTASKQSKNERIEKFLRERYEFRFNTVKSRTEFRERKDEASFSPLSKFDVNSMRRLLDAQIGITTSADNIRAILKATFARK